MEDSNVVDTEAVVRLLCSFLLDACNGFELLTMDFALIGKELTEERDQAGHIIALDSGVLGKLLYCWSSIPVVGVDLLFGFGFVLDCLRFGLVFGYLPLRLLLLLFSYPILEALSFLEDMVITLAIPQAIPVGFSLLKEGLKAFVKGSNRGQAMVSKVDSSSSVIIFFWLIVLDDKERQGVASVVGRTVPNPLIVVDGEELSGLKIEIS